MSLSLIVVAWTPSMHNLATSLPLTNSSSTHTSVTSTLHIPSYLQLESSTSLPLLFHPTSILQSGSSAPTSCLMSPPTSFSGPPLHPSRTPAPLLLTLSKSKLYYCSQSSFMPKTNNLRLSNTSPTPSIWP